MTIIPVTCLSPESAQWVLSLSQAVTEAHAHRLQETQPTPWPYAAHQLDMLMARLGISTLPGGKVNVEFCDLRNWWWLIAALPCLLCLEMPKGLRGCQPGRWRVLGHSLRLGQRSITTIRWDSRRHCFIEFIFKCKNRWAHTSHTRSHSTNCRSPINCRLAHYCATKHFSHTHTILHGCAVTLLIATSHWCWRWWSWSPLWDTNKFLSQP